ncbi:hypothetical protein LINPERHAP1_LOCUS20465 [Linum perenne]
MSAKSDADSGRKLEDHRVASSLHRSLLQQCRLGYWDQCQELSVQVQLPQVSKGITHLPFSGF